MSMIGDMFSSPKTPSVPPPPTIDTAAAAEAATEAEENKRRSWQTGNSSAMLTSVGGVPAELTGSRMLTGS